MMATIWGAEIVCPLPIGSGWSRYAESRKLCGTKSSRLTAPIAYTTRSLIPRYLRPVSYTHLRAHETGRNLVCRLLLEKKKKKKNKKKNKKKKKKKKNKNIKQNKK